MARFCPLASGSSGNSTYISDGKSAVLIDAGIPYKTICERVSLAGGSMEKIAAVAVTHSHTDHVRGLKTLLQKTHIPLYITTAAAEDLIRKGLLPPGADLIFIDEPKAAVCDMEIVRFSTSHDAPGSCGYRINTRAGSCAVCTDSGVVTDEMRAGILGSAVLLLEFNHDIDLLRRGPYPPHLKIRILSDLGHLSNTAAAAEIPSVLGSGTKQLILGRLFCYLLGDM